MLKVAGITLTGVLILITGIGASAADKIALTCSGTKIAGNNKELASQSLIVELDRGIVTIESIGELSIVRSMENSITFEARSEDGQTAWKGDIDRFSGLAVVSVWRGERVVMHYQLNCRRPEPLF